MAGGVGGFDLSGTALRYVLAAEGLPYAIHVFPWGHGFGRWFADLTDVPNRDGKAAQLADAVRRFRARQPDVPIFLVAKSGGSGVVVKALEQLEEGSVERTILLAPALSPDYDLTAALRAVARDMVVFWSPLDVFLLGLGTRVFGTADRVKTVSAGMVGFRVPPVARGVPGRCPARRPVRQAAPGAMGPADGGDRLPGRSLRTGFSGFSQELCCAPAADGAGRPVLNRGPGSSQSDTGPISLWPEARIVIG